MQATQRQPYLVMDEGGEKKKWHDSLIEGQIRL